MSDYAERRDAAYDVTLTAIDDAVEERCTQCHEQLPESRLSEFFCSQECQWGWHQQQATDPGAVYVRGDAGYQMELEALRQRAGVATRGSGCR